MRFLPFLLAVGCGPPAEPIPPEDRDPARVAVAEQLGNDILTAWARDEYPPVDRATERFRSGWTEDVQRAADEHFEPDLGDFVSMRLDDAERVGTDEAYEFRATFDRTPREQIVRVVLDPEGRLAGFWIRPAPAAASEPLPTPSVPLLLVVAAQTGVLVGGPVVLVLLASRRLGAPPRLALVGALAFVASQLVHLPLNFALGLLGPPRAVGAMALPIVAVVAGLTAGICEEGARYVAMRWVLPKDRGWGAAVQYGLGHGGVEATIVGALVGIGLVGMLAVPWLGNLGVPEAQLPVVYEAARAYWDTPLYMPLLAVWERVCAMTFHCAASVIVMRAVVEGRLRWLLLAIALHALVDAPVVYAHQMGLLALYALLTVEAVTGAVFLVASRPTRRA